MKAKMIHLNKVFSDGSHNAFTDLIYWKNFYYLAFRRGKDHSQDGFGSIYILRTEEPSAPWNWEHVATIDSGFDDRDPKFFTFNNHLGIVFGSYILRTGSIDKSHIGSMFYLVSHMSVSHNGVIWSTPTQISRIDHWIWSIKELDFDLADQIQEVYGLSYSPVLIGASYQAVPEKDRMTEIDLFVASNLISWDKLGTITRSRNYYLSEPHIIMDPREDSLYDIHFIVRMSPYSRIKNNQKTSFSSIRFDTGFNAYFDVVNEILEDNELHSSCHLYIEKLGHFICSRKFNHKFIKNKKGITVEEETSNYVVLDYVSDLDDPKFETLLEFPSNGDTGYPGMAWNWKNKTLLVSYYSQHEVDKYQKLYLPVQSDIYVAEVELKL